MAFSANNQKNNRENRGDTNGVSTLDSRHNPSNSPLTFKSYADSLKVQQRTSFDITPTVSNSVDSALDSYFTNKSAFLEATEPHSIIIDFDEVKGMNFKEKSLDCVLKDVYPNGLGMKKRLVGKSKQYIELNFKTESDCKAALEKKLFIQDKEIPVSKSLDANANVIRVGISEIPFLAADYIQPRLVEIFQGYGDILNIGLCHIVTSGWFTGRGFVTLNRDKTKVYAKELTPQVEFENGRMLHLVWSNMRPVCKVCHVDSHIKADCPKVLATKKRCFLCQSPHHLKAGCPTAPWNRNKQQENNNKDQQQVEEINKEVTQANGNGNQSEASQGVHQQKDNRILSPNRFDALNQADGEEEEDDWAAEINDHSGDEGNDGNNGPTEDEEMGQQQEHSTPSSSQMDVDKENKGEKREREEIAEVESDTNTEGATKRSGRKGRKPFPPQQQQ
jgi:hypothetical protein